jgi:BCD family chlorophyll transporter-like MFS transporter
MLIKRLQLGLIHIAVAMTLVPMNSTLNRVMIKELALAATLVAAFASLPYLFSPMQVWIGGCSDRHPLFGRRRTPYIVMGLLLCAAGVVVSPHVAFWMAADRATGIVAGLLAFGAWGMGFNLASVSYFSLASELSGEKGRGRTVAVMFFMMIAGIILTSITLSQMVEPYSPEALARSFGVIGVLALILGLLGLIGLEKRAAGPAAGAENYTLRQMAEALLANPQARTFFWYLFLLLIALLGQDILLEPFAAQAFGLPVAVTTRITSIWGVCVLVTLVIAGALEGRFPKRRIAQAGNYGALASFALITASGLIPSLPVFYAGVLLLGLGTGLSTVANLSLMLDMTTARNVGLYIGAWGMANAFSRLAGGLLGGAVRDLATRLLGNLVLGYVAVFALETLLLLAAVLLFLRIDVAAFRRRAEDLSMLERAAMSTG